MEEKKVFYNTLKSAFDNYDEIITNNQNLYSNVNYASIINNGSDIDLNEIEFYDKDKKIIQKNKFEIIGYYYPRHKLWVWGWAIPYLQKKTIQTVKKMWLYGLSLSYFDSTLKAQLSNSRFIVSDILQVDSFIALTVYLSKNKLFYDFHEIENEVIWYMILHD